VGADGRIIIAEDSLMVEAQQEMVGTFQRVEEDPNRAINAFTHAKRTAPKCVWGWLLLMDCPLVVWMDLLLASWGLDEDLGSGRASKVAGPMGACRCTCGGKQLQFLGHTALPRGSSSS